MNVINRIENLISYIDNYSSIQNVSTTGVTVTTTADRGGTTNATGAGATTSPVVGAAGAAGAAGTSGTDSKDDEKNDERVILLTRNGFQPKKIEVVLPDQRSILAWYDEGSKRSMLKSHIMEELVALGHAKSVGYTELKGVGSDPTEYELFLVRLTFDTLDENFKNGKKYSITYPVCSGPENIIGDDFQKYCTDGQINDRKQGIEYVLVDDPGNYEMDICNYPGIKYSIYAKSKKFSCSFFDFVHITRTVFCWFFFFYYYYYYYYYFCF